MTWEIPGRTLRLARINCYHVVEHMGIRVAALVVETLRQGGCAIASETLTCMFPGAINQHLSLGQVDYGDILAGRRALIRLPLAVINASTLVDFDELLVATAAVQVQVTRDFAPAWNVGAELALVRPGEKPPTSSWWIVILDNSDLGAALGYHDLTSQGLPMAKVFVATAKRTGQEWTVLFSHEVLEMLADPFICLTALAPSAYGALLYAYENCDACQSDKYGYRIDGQLVSDFCLPSWFDANKIAAVKSFDFCKHMTQPFQLLPGGYAMCQALSYPTGWQLVTAPGTPLTYTNRPRVGSRRERRRTNVVDWHKSAVETGDDFRVANLVRPGAGVQS